MAWNDAPSEAQIGALLNLIRWETNNEEVPRIVEYLRKYATKSSISSELGRLRLLKIGRRLNRENAFEGELWENFK